VTTFLKCCENSQDLTARISHITADKNILLAFSVTANAVFLQFTDADEQIIV